MGRDEDEQAVHVLHVRPGEPLELPLSPYVSTYLAQFGTRKPPAARPSRQRGRTGSRSRSRQRTASAGFGGDRSPSPETPALDAADPDPDAESEDQREALPFARVVHAGAAALPVGTAAIAPFRNDGMRFNEWPAAAPAIGERDASPVGRTGVTAAVKGLREQLRVPSPRLELPSIAGDESGVSRAKPKRTKAAAVPQPATESGRHSAPPGELHYAPPSSLGDAYLPIDLWNNVVARKVDLDPLPHFQRGSASFNAMARPFNRLRTRQYMSTSLRPMIEKVPKERVPVEPREASPREKLAYAALFEEGREAAAQATRPDAPPSRLEASLLKKALETMTNNIKNEKGEEPRHLARQAAIRGQIEQVSTKLEPELYVLDMIMSEVVKQTNLACRERGSVLESIRLRFLEAFSTASLCISRACSDMDHIAEESEMVAGKMAPLQQLNEELSGKVEALEHANAGLHSKVDELTETLESLRRSYQVAIDEDQEGTSLKEQQANQLIKEANSMREMLQGKLRVLNAQLSQQDANKEVMHLQIQQLEDRVRRDAEKLEFLGQTVAEYKIRLAWTRVLAWARRTKKETADAETQDGEGLPEVSSISRLPSTVRPSTRGSETFGRTLSKDEERARVVTKESLKGQVIAYSAFWAGVVMQAEQMDFNLRPHLQMTKKELLELIAKTYSEKILADDIDERAKMSRQTLPEFLFDYYLNLFGEPQLAEEALVIIVANVRTYDTTSPRAWMFSRFLSLGGQPLPIEALTIYLASLVRIQNGQIPLLPSYDGLNVDAARALRVIEWVFLQVPYVVRARVLQECEKLSSGIYVDLDALLLCIVEQWKEESSHAEERLRALFVASDIDGDGNLDFQEFTTIINNLRGGKGHREMLRMYSEMTLNKTVDCNTFVRVCRKYRFFTFEVGPVTKKADPNAKEIFDTLADEWDKFDRTAMELLTICAGTSAANRLEQLVVVFKKKLAEKADAEESWHVFRHVIEDMTAMVRNHPKELPPFFAGMAMKAPAGSSK